MQKTPASSVKSLSNLFVFLLILVIAGIGGLLFFAFQTLPPYAATVNQQLLQANLVSFNEDSNTTDSSAALSSRALKFFATPKNYANQVQKDVATYAALTSVPLSTVTTNPAETDAKSAVITISLDGPVDYKNLLQFTTAIESNVPKISVTELSITRSPSNPALVTLDSLKASVALK